MYTAARLAPRVIELAPAGLGCLVTVSEAASEGGWTIPAAGCALARAATEEKPSRARNQYSLPSSRNCVPAAPRRHRMAAGCLVGYSLLLPAATTATRGAIVRGRNNTSYTCQGGLRAGCGLARRLGVLSGQRRQREDPAAPT
jgi:hypothetical protein